MKILYNAEKGRTKIFGNTFVKKNKSRIKIISEYKLLSLREEAQFKNTNIQKIKIIKLRKISNLSFMFEGCNSLLEISEKSIDNQKSSKENFIDELVTKNIIIIKPDELTKKNMFYQSFNFLKNKQLLPIKNTLELINERIIDMKALFKGCKSLSSLPNISLWNTNNVSDMSYLFSYCESLLLLPDISKWNTSNVKNMSYMFSECTLLSLLPDISKWNTDNLKDMSYMFFGCSTLLQLPDLSKWNTKNKINMNYTFYDCLLLSDEYKLDFSFWNINNFNIFKQIFRFLYKEDKSELKQNIEPVQIYILTYKIPNEDKKEMKILGKEFVDNNKDKAIIIYDSKIIPIQEYLKNKEKKEKKEVDIVLMEFEIIYDRSYMFHNCDLLVRLIYLNVEKDIETKNKKDIISYFLRGQNLYTKYIINNINYMFSGCKSLKFISDISSWNIDNIKEMKCLFNECNMLYSLPDISKWNTINVKDMSYLFNSCLNLRSLPDISKWNTVNVEDMSNMFSGCYYLKSLPDISKWYTKNVKYMSSMFSCELKSLPDLSGWNTENVKDMDFMFYHCNIESLPDISKWNTGKVYRMSYMFSQCYLLKSLPDISKWNTEKVAFMNSMFDNCLSLKSLPDISKWNTKDVQDMSLMFNNCNSLSSIPDISKWTFLKEVNVSNMFKDCSSLISIPDISKWNAYSLEDEKLIKFNI